ncbi:hypothetical protein B0H14DRAFT_2971118 [Mycena olivaceomarginata]|nr:hypothetical protein B0H14DRAFT_2971118 [Mycena olivaceomarginata]
MAFANRFLLSLAPILLVLDATSRTSAQLVSTGLSVMFNDLSVSSTSLSNVPSVYGFKPVTVVQEAVTLSGIPSLLSNWTAIDDGMVNGSSSLILSLSNPTIPSGPYFLEMATGSLYPALLQTPGGTFQPLSAQIPGSASLTIGTADKPLAGVRIGVKDIYQLAGVKNSNGNRAWHGRPAPQALRSLQRRDGHCRLGRLPLALQSRGDGYQDPSSSSSGAGGWTLLSNWGSGLFGNRPSHGLVPLDHVMPLSTTLDTPANLVLYGDNYTSLAYVTPKYPTTIYTVGFPTNTSFVGGTVTALTLEDVWASSGPPAAGHITLSQLLNITYATLISKEQTPLIACPIAALDAAIFNKTLLMDWFKHPDPPPRQRPPSSNPRNQYFSAHPLPFGFGTDSISIMAECPDSALSFGTELAKDLVAAGILPVPEVGGSITGRKKGLKMRYIG